MICNKCKIRPVPRGIKDITCWKCGNKEYVRADFTNICNNCSEELNICQICGKVYTQKALKPS